MRYVLWTLVIVGLSAAGVSLYGTKPGPTVTVAPESTPYRFQPATCWFDADWKIDIRCGHLVTDNTAGVFTLPVVVIKADKNTAKSAPILYLQGGPGASAGLTTDGIKEWVSWSRLANTQRDLVLLDTRGVGGALPALQCQTYNQLNQQLMRQNPTLAEELAQSAEVTKACFDEMLSADQRLSPANFGSYQSARDIRALMPLLGYEHWHILGVSYGTRLALEVARQEADLGATGLTSMVLDSVYPAGYGGVQTWPQVFNEAIDRFVAECVTIDGCRVALMTNQVDSIPALFDEALASLSASSVFLTVKHREGEAPIYWILNDHRLMSVIFSMIYDTDRWGDVIALLVAGKHRRGAALEGLVEPYLNRTMTTDFNNLAFVAVDCADNAVGDRESYSMSLDQFPRWKPYLMDQWDYQACHWLPTQYALKPFSPEIPVLLISGKLDPITPVSWAIESAKRWSNSVLITRNNVGHSVLSSDLCLLEQITYYFEGDVESVLQCDLHSE